MNKKQAAGISLEIMAATSITIGGTLWGWAVMNGAPFLCSVTAPPIVIWAMGAVGFGIGFIGATSTED